MFFYNTTIYIYIYTPYRGVIKILFRWFFLQDEVVSKGLVYIKHVFCHDTQDETVGDGRPSLHCVGHGWFGHATYGNTQSWILSLKVFENIQQIQINKVLISLHDYSCISPQGIGMRGVFCRCQNGSSWISVRAWLYHQQLTCISLYHPMMFVLGEMYTVSTLGYSVGTGKGTIGWSKHLQILPNVHTCRFQKVIFICTCTSKYH